MQNKTFIKNRKDQKMVVVVEESSDPRGLVFIMHGLGGYKEEPHLVAVREIFQDNGFTVVYFDTTNTFGESDGNYEDATTTNYYEDLEDVINWANSQSWFKKPFWLVGHSLGGISTALYAERHGEEIKGLAPMSTVISGSLSLKTPQYQNNDVLKKWEETGFKETHRLSRPGVKRLKWSHLADRLKYNLLPEANKLTMPVLLIVGDQDEGTPPEHQKMLFDALPGKKELHIIKGAPHTYKDPAHLLEIKEIFDKWIKSNN